MPAAVRTVSKDAVNCPARSRTRNLKSAARPPRSIRRLRICWVVQGPSGLAVTPRICTERAPTSMTNRQYRRRRSLRSPVEEVGGEHGPRLARAGTAARVVAVCRFGAGGIRSALRTRRIVDALTRWPSLK